MANVAGKIGTSQVMKRHQPCDDCGSSDALAIYDDGHKYCFSCTKYTPPTYEAQNMGANVVEFTDRDVTESLGTISGFSSYPISSRMLTKETVDHYNVKMSVDIDGMPEAHYYPYTRKGKLVAYKKRTLPKDFSVVGNFAGVELFGQQQAVGGRKLIITEGELDCMAVAQAVKDHYKKYYSVVSIPSASQTKCLLDQRDFILQYPEVVLLFDQDEAGEKAVEAAAKIIGVGRTFVAKYNAKDPCDLYKSAGKEGIMNAIFNAAPYNPAGILTGEAIWEKYQERKNTESVPYPGCLQGLNDKLGGMRHGEITLFTSGTGSGKSTVIKEIILDLLEKTDDKIGLVSLEESIGDTAEKFIAMQIRRPLVGDHEVSEHELRSGFDAIFGDNRLVLLDHQGAASDAALLDKIEYMALMGCKYIVLDHITIAVSEGSDGLSGNEAVDKTMSDLLKIVKKHNVWLGLISHLRKSQNKAFEEGQLASIDDIKGSGSIKQISFDIVAFARNLVAESDIERNTIRLRVLKARFTGNTGDCGSAVYDPKTTRLTLGGEVSFEY